MKNYLGLVDEYEVPTGYDCYIWSGDFCVNGIDWCIDNEKKYEVMPTTDFRYEDIHEIYLYLEQVKNKVIGYLKNILNEYHKANYSEYKWRIMLNQWLTYFLPSMYDKYLTLKKIVNDGRKYYVNLADTECSVNILDQLDFFNVLHEDFGFHKYEYSVLLKYMQDVDNIEVANLGEYRRIALKEYNYGELPKHVKEFVEQYKSYKEKIRIPDEMIIESSYIKFTIHKEIMEKKYGKISGYFTHYVDDVRKKIKFDIDLDVNWRKKKREIVGEKDEFVSLIYNVIGDFVPIAYLEEYNNLKRIALDNYRWGLNPKVLVYDTEGIVLNEMFKIYLMNIDVENIYKVDIQHALPYNIGGYSWYALTEFQMCDEFLICNDMHNETIPIKFTRMPFISFFRIDMKGFNSGNEIIYLNYAYAQHRGSLSEVEWNWGKHIKDEIKFLRLLDEKVLAEFKFRKHPLHKTQWKNDERVKEEIPSIMFDETPDLYRSLKNAKLVIAEVFGAAAMESIAVGKPTLVLFNPKELCVEINDNYVDIEDMIRVEIIAETPERLAAIVNRIHNNVESWWNEPERQNVIRRIREKYTYFPDNAKKMWIDKITSYID